jgi:predicted amidohydrolase YtcJ
MKYMIADLVLKNANVYTMDQALDRATGIAIKHQKIIFVGDEEDLKDYIGESTKIVDIKGKMVLPGFIDAHAHPVMTAFLSHSAMFDMDMKVEDVANTLKKHIEENPDYEAYIGIAYNETNMDP